MAKDNKDVSACSLVSGEAAQGWCVTLAAEPPDGDINLCKTVKDHFSNARCYATHAVHQDDQSVCDDATHPQTCVGQMKFLTDYGPKP